MILPDVNLLIYAYNTGDPHHPAAKEWVEGLFNGSPKFALSWLTISDFLRIITARSLFGNGYTPKEALDIVEVWLEHPNVYFLAPTARHFQIFKSQVIETKISGAKLTDAHIATLSIEHGLTLATKDSDFRRFKGLRVIYPLSQKPK